MTRVLVDLLFYTGTRGGMESYIRSLYEQMPDDLEYVAFASAEFARSAPAWFPGEVVDSGVPSRRRAAWAWGEIVALPRAAARLNADLIHAPANLGPWRSPVPTVLTVHDLLPFRHPEYVPGHYGPALRALVRGAARNARRILTLSEASRSDIASVLGIDPSRIDVAPLAGGTPLSSIPANRAERLVLALGNRMPHKNYELLIRSIALIPEPRRPRLVITGGSRDDPLRPLVTKLGLEPWVDLRGWVEHAVVEELYATASAVAVPSLFEGFGLPVVEAMSRGCPVICSDIPVLREVAGSAAMFVDPHDASAWAGAIEGLLADASRRSELGRAGWLRSREFTWQRTARDTAASLRRALG